MKKHKKLFQSIKYILYILLGICLAVLLVIVCCRLVVKSTDYTVYYQGELSEVSGFDFILVPGAAIYQDKPGTYLQDRLDTAFALYQTQAAPKIILSGGFDDASQLYESAVMKLYLEKKGIRSQDIICDNYGIDTAETIRRTLDYINDKKVIICTQSLYAPRTAFLAKHYGLHAAFADSDIKIYTSNVGKTRLRETLAATKAVYEGFLCKEARFSLSDYPMIIGDAIHEE